MFLWGSAEEADHGGDGGVVVSNSISRNRPDMEDACIGSDDSRGSEVTLVRAPPGTRVATTAVSSSTTVVVDFMFVVEVWKKREK